MILTDLSNGINYTISVYSVDASGNQSNIATTTGTTLALPLFAPTNLSLNSITSSSMVLTYTAGYDTDYNNTQYPLAYYVTTYPTTDTFIGDNDGTSITLTGLSSNTTYRIDLWTKSTKVGVGVVEKNVGPVIIYGTTN